MKQVLPWAVFGFAIGYAVGLVLGQKTNSKIGENVSTQTRDGKVIVTVDVMQAASDGLTDFFGG